MSMDDPGTHATFGAVAGAIGMKIVDKIFRMKNRKLDEATLIRQELREQVNQLNDRITALSNELDHWKEKYFQLSEENLSLKQSILELKNR